MTMSKLFALGALAALSIASSLPAAANYAGSGSATSINRAGTDRQDYFRLNRLRSDGSSLVLSCIDDSVLLGANAAA